jgi:hypothetical protein
MQNFIALIARAEKNKNNSNLGWTTHMGTLYKKAVKSFETAAAASQQFLNAKNSRTVSLMKPTTENQ